MKGLWISQQGVMACGERGHGGGYLNSSVQAMKERGKFEWMIDTPLDNWMYVLQEDIDKFKNRYDDEFGCEQCREEEERAHREQPATIKEETWQ